MAKFQEGPPAWRIEQRTNGRRPGTPMIIHGYK